MCSRGLFAQCETTQVREQGTGAVAVRLQQALRAGARRPGASTCASRRRTSARSRCPTTAARTSATCTCPTCCRPRGRPSSTPRPRRRDRRRGRPRPDRADGRPDRRPPGCVSGHRPRPGARAPRDGAPARHRRHRRQRGRRRRRGGPRAHGRPRRRLHDRRGRHGGARVAGGLGRAAGGRASCRTRWPRPSSRRPASTASPPCRRRSTSVRRGGTVSIVGVYGGAADPLPMMQLFDKGLTLRMGQANVKRWIDDLLPLVVGRRRTRSGVLDLRTHRSRWRRRPRPTRCSRRRRTAASRSSSTRRWCDVGRSGCASRARATVGRRAAPEPGGCTREDGSRP